MSTIGQMNVALRLDDSDFSAGIARAQSSAESFSKKLGSLGQTMSLAVTAPLVGIAAAAVASAGKFEQSMNVMGQVTGATASEMEALQAQALELGAVTSFSAGEAADAMLELGKAGLAPAEIGDAIAGTMDLAAAGNLDLANAASITANALNAFQLPAENAAEVANMFAAAANASSVDVTDLAAGMQMAGAVFASNGQSIGDLSTAIAILGNNAVSGSDAGTSLKTMLLSMAAPTKEAAGVMADLGIEVFNADGSMRGFGDIVGNLETATNDLSDAERNMALKTIFGSDAIRAATILASEGADGFADMSKAVNKQGAAAATANARMKGIGGAIEYLKGSIDSFLINAALPFLDTLSGFVRGAADFLTMIGELPEPVRNTALAIAAVAAAAGPVLLIISKLVPLFSMFGTVMGVIVSPIGLVVAAVAALVAVFATDFMGIRTAVMGFVDSFIEMSGIDLGGIIQGFKDFGSYLGLVISDGDVLNDWLTHLPEAIQPVVQAFGGLVATLMSDMSVGEKIAAISADIGALFTEITALDWGGAWAAFQTWLDGWAAAVVSKVKEIDWGGAAETAGNMFAVLSNVVVYHLKKIPWSDIIGTAGNLFWQLTEAIATAWDAIPWDTIIAADTALSKKLEGMVGGWSDDMAVEVEKMDFTTVITNWLSSITTQLNDFDWSSLGTAFAESLNNAFAPSEGTSVFSGLDAAIAKGIGDIKWDKVKASLSKLDTAFAEGLGKFGEAFSGTLDIPAWSEFIGKLEWPTITAPSWSEFIADLKWPTIPEVKWGDFIPDLEWPKIPSFPGWAEILRALGFSPPATAGPAAAPSTSGGGYGNFNSVSPTTNGVPPPTPNQYGKGGYIDIPPQPPAPPDINAPGFGMGGNVIGAVYVNNSVDVNEIAYKVAQANQRRYA